LGNSSDVLDVINECITDLNKQLPVPERLAPGLEATLIGEGGTLDSLALVTLIASIEQALSERLAIDLPLIDEVIGDYRGEAAWTVGNLLELVVSRQAEG